MKIYCAGPIRGDTSYSSYYQDIVRLVEELKHIPLTELALADVEKKTFTDKCIYRRDIGWLNEASAMIAEVSGPSSGVGYEIAYALHVRKIRVLCLRHRFSKNLSAMIAGNRSEWLTVKMYDSGKELERIVKGFLESVGSSKQ